MDFMQKQVTGKQSWFRVETDNGTECFPADLVGSIPDMGFDSDSDDYWDHVDTLQTYTEGKPQSWETVQGYGARLSAPGYMDCTEWGVFDTEEEAEKYLQDTYDDDDAEESC
jgi:hypothetical protein